MQFLSESEDSQEGKVFKTAVIIISINIEINPDFCFCGFLTEIWSKQKITMGDFESEDLQFQKEKCNEEIQIEWLPCNAIFLQVVFEEICEEEMKLHRQEEFTADYSFFSWIRSNVGLFKIKQLLQLSIRRENCLKIYVKVFTGGPDLSRSTPLMLVLMELF